MLHYIFISNFLLLFFCGGDGIEGWGFVWGFFFFGGGGLGGGGGVGLAGLFSSFGFEDQNIVNVFPNGICVTVTI